LKREDGNDKDIEVVLRDALAGNGLRPSCAPDCECHISRKNARRKYSRRRRVIMVIQTGRSIQPIPSLLLAATFTAAIGIANITHASFDRPLVTLNWNASGTGQPNTYVMYEDSDSFWYDKSNNAWVSQGGDNGSAWNMNWTTVAADAPGGALGAPGASQFVNANLAVTNNTDSYQTFIGLVTFLLPKEFHGGTLMNGSVSVSVQDVFGTGAEVRTVDDVPIYQAFIDGAMVQDLFPGDFSLIATGGVTESTSDSFGIPSPIGGPEAMETISVMLNFELSPYDTANVVGTFEVAAALPAPGALALLAGFGLISSRRRRQ
jgi:hypothetical protein